MCWFSNPFKECPQYKGPTVHLLGRKVSQCDLETGDLLLNPPGDDLIWDKSVPLGVGPQFCFLKNWVWLSVFWTYLVIFRDVFSRNRRGKEDTVRGWGEERWRQVKKNLSSSILLLRRTLIFNTAFCYEISQYIVKLKDFCRKHPSTHYLESTLRILLCLFYHIFSHRCVLCALWILFGLHGPLGHGDSPQIPQGPGKVGVSCQLVTETTGVGRFVPSAILDVLWGRVSSCSFTEKSFC